jgi:AraC-like DNA-binding protein
MPLDLSSIATVIEAAERTLAGYQVDAAGVLMRAGIRKTDDPDARISGTRLRAFWREAIAATSDPCFGFSVGRAVLPPNLHAVGYALLASRTLKEGLQRLARYDRMLTTGWDIVLNETEDEIEIAIREVRAGTMPQAARDGVFCAVVGLCRAVTSTNFNPERIEMSRERPPCAVKLGAFFGCDVAYGADRDALYFDRVAANKVLPRQNPTVARANDAVVERYLMNFDRDDIVRQTASVLADILPRGAPGRAEVAERLTLSERTLHRRLASSGRTFRELLDETRHKLAVEYLAEGRHSLLEIAFLLGFTDPSNFARAFRRWKGKGPKEFRRALRAAANDSDRNVGLG